MAQFVDLISTGLGDDGKSKCGGILLSHGPLDPNAVTQGVLPAYYRFTNQAGEKLTLIRWSFDGDLGPFLTGKSLLDPSLFSNGFYPVKLPDKPVSQVCLIYDGNEGGALLFITAMDQEGNVIRPPKAKQDVTSEYFPLKTYALVDSDPDSNATYPTPEFTWADEGYTRWNVGPNQIGAWKYYPPEGEHSLVASAKPTMPSSSGAIGYEFSHGEYLVLTPTTDEPTSTDIDLVVSTRIEIGINLYYKPVSRAGGKIHEPIHLPGPISIGDPPIRQLLVLIARAVAFDLEHIRLGIFQPFRHVPGLSGHGEALPQLRLAPDVHRRIVEAAKAYPNDGGQLEALLSELES